MIENARYYERRDFRVVAETDIPTATCEICSCGGSRERDEHMPAGPAAPRAGSVLPLWHKLGPAFFCRWEAGDLASRLPRPKMQARNVCPKPSFSRNLRTAALGQHRQIPRCPRRVRSYSP